MKGKIIITFFLRFSLFIIFLSNQKVVADDNLFKYSYDQNGVRYQLVNSNPVDNKNWNWIFIPGGPGYDSSSLLGLTQILDLPGKTWLIDFPGNGSNTKAIPRDYAYDQWFDFFIPMIKHFENPIVVGFSFGGMITLLTPELEKYLKGVVILSSAPKLWLEEAAACAKKYHLPDFSPQLEEFILNPSEEACKKLLDVCVVYYFYKKETFERGRELLLSTSFAFQPGLWWMDKVASKGYTATWIPKNVPTLIIGNEFDYMTPFGIFKNDQRFLRPNIQFVEIKAAGHFNWIDNPEDVKAAFQNYSRTLN